MLILGNVLILDVLIMNGERKNFKIFGEIFSRLKAPIENKVIPKIVCLGLIAIEIEIRNFKAWSY